MTLVATIAPRQKQLVDSSFPLKIHTFSAKITIVRTQRMAYKNVTFGIDVLYPLKHSFGMFPFHKFHIKTFHGVGCVSA